ncbi:MAG: YceI family protein [Planctomycetota bacterium]
MLAVALLLPALMPVSGSREARRSGPSEVDPVMSSAVFRIGHGGISHFYGMFEEVGGTVDIDPAKENGGSIEIEVAAASVRTHDEKRDAHLKGPDFFDVKQYPSIRFASSSISATGEDRFRVRGTLEMRGRKKEIEVLVTKTGEGEFMGKRVGYETTFSLLRSDFGMDYGIAQKALSDEVDVTLGISCIRK